MLRYDQIKILLAEIPDEISLGISLAGCPRHCEGCHSSYLWDTDRNLSVRPILDEQTLDDAIERFERAKITCLLFLGGEWDLMALISLIRHVKQKYDLGIGLYSGANLEALNGISELVSNLAYLKVGEYRKDLGGLTCRSTNQRLYRIKNNSFQDITYKFWR